MKALDILIAFEYSGEVRDAFIAAGHNAVSCDLLATERPGPHYKGDIGYMFRRPWDMIIAFPPCTHLAVSGSRHFAAKRADGRQQQGIDLFMQTVRAVEDCGCGGIENPVGIMSTLHRKPDQIIQPWQFGHGETKATCLWLTNLPLLIPTDVVEGREQRIWKMPPSADRAKLRSKTYEGIARQWLHSGAQLNRCPIRS